MLIHDGIRGTGRSGVHRDSHGGRLPLKCRELRSFVNKWVTEGANSVDTYAIEFPEQGDHEAGRDLARTSRVVASVGSRPSEGIAGSN